MALVILNDELALHASQQIFSSLSNKLWAEFDKLRNGTGNSKKIADICTEISNIARQIEQNRKEQVEVNF